MARSRGKEQGVALLVVLLLLATLSAMTISFADDLRDAVGRSRASESYAQARWYAMGAEDIALELLALQWKLEPNYDRASDQWLTPQTFPLPDGAGTINASLRDGSACFNINTLSTALRQTQEGGAANAGIREFRLLLEGMGLDAFTQDTLTALVTDWTDQDDFARAGGAEDTTYARASPPYRTGNTAFADVSELRPVAGMTPAFYKAIAPLLCARPSTRPTQINVNLIETDEAAVLYAALGGVVELRAVEAAIEQRPAEGYATIDTFWQSVGLAPGDVPPEARQRVLLYSSRIELKARVNHNGTSFDLVSAIGIDAGRAMIESRRIGLDL